MKIYTADEIAGELKICKKSVLNLVKRGLLKSLPGLRHIRITEAEFQRYLGVHNVQPGAAITSAPANPLCNLPANPPARPAGAVSIMDKSPVGPAAKVVASPVAQLSQKKSK